MEEAKNDPRIFDPWVLWVINFLIFYATSGYQGQVTAPVPVPGTSGNQKPPVKPAKKKQLNPVLYHAKAVGLLAFVAYWIFTQEPPEEGQSRIRTTLLSIAYLLIPFVFQFVRWNISAYWAFRGRTLAVIPTIFPRGLVELIGPFISYCSFFWRWMYRIVFTILIVATTRRPMGLLSKIVADASEDETNGLKYVFRKVSEWFAEVDLIALIKLAPMWCKIIFGTDVILWALCILMYYVFFSKKFPYQVREWFGIVMLFVSYKQPEWNWVRIALCVTACDKLYHAPSVIESVRKSSLSSVSDSLFGWISENILYKDLPLTIGFWLYAYRYRGDYWTPISWLFDVYFAILYASSVIGFTVGDPEGLGQMSGSYLDPKRKSFWVSILLFYLISQMEISPENIHIKFGEGASSGGGFGDSTGDWFRDHRHWWVQDDWAYKLLEVEKGAPPEKIVQACRKMKLKWHPDKNPTNTEEATKKFREVVEACELIGPARGSHRGAKSD